MDVFTRNGRRLESNPDLSIKVIKKVNREKAPVARARPARRCVYYTHIRSIARAETGRADRVHRSY